LVSVRLGGHLSPTGRLTELTGGVSYPFFIRDLALRLEKLWPAILADLHDVHRFVARRNQALVSLTADTKALPGAESLFRELVRALPEHPAAGRVWERPELPGAEALLVPAQVNYVGLGANLRNTGYAFHGSASVV